MLPLQQRRKFPPQQQRQHEVEAILIEDRTETMYDLTVDEVHTFAVGEGDWVVHNNNNLSYFCLNTGLSGTNEVWYRYTSWKVQGRRGSVARAEGVFAHLLEPWSRDLKPLPLPGYNSSLGHNLGHLLPDSLGGTNQRINLAILYEDVNQVVMRPYENTVLKALRRGETFDYAVIPVYDNSNITWIPTSIWMYANGSKGTNFFVNIPNTP